MGSPMSRNANNSIDWQWLQSAIFLGDEGKIHLPHVSIDITKGCNMRCEHCSHLSPLMQGHFPKDELLKFLEHWGQKLQPKRLAILGGEPLLHPNFEEIVLSAYRHWGRTEIVIITNGVLLERIQDSFLERIRKLGRISFVISQHTKSTGWKEKYKKTKIRFSKFHIPFSLRKSYSLWMTTYQKSAAGRYIPYESFPQKAWEVCWGRSFYKIHEGSLWYCTRLVSANLAIKEGLFGDEWKHILSHHPMTLESSQDEILAYLKQKALPECSMCPEVVELIEPLQMN